MAINWNDFDNTNRPQLPQPKQSIFKKGINALGWVGDQLSRVNYASANIAKTITDNKSDSIGNVLKAGYRGLSLKDKTTYADVLDQAGVKNKYAKAIGGFAGDVLLDPTTYLTLGVGAGAKIATKTGAKTLSKAGTKQLSRMSGNLGREFAEKTLAKAVEKSPQLASKYVDKGGVKFAGKMIPLTDRLVSPVSNKVRGLTGKAGRDASIRNNPQFIRQQQAFRDSLESNMSKYTQGYQKAFKGLDKNQRELITRAIDEGKVNLLPANLKAPAKFAQKELDDILRQEKGRGLIKEGLDNYITHIYENPEDAKKFSNYVNTVRPGTRFAKERAIPTLAEAESLGLKPKLDIEEVLRQRRASSLRATGKSDFLTDVARTQGTPTTKIVDGKEVPNQTPLGNAQIIGTKELSGVSLPSEIAEYIQKLDKQVIQSESISKTLKLYDKAQNFWKGSVTTWFPAFHVRNAVSNLLQNYLDVGLVQTLNHKFHTTAMKVMGNGNPAGIVKIGKKTYTAGQLRKIMQDSGVLQGIGFFDVKGATSKYNAGRRTGRFIENEARGVNFLANLALTGDPVTAAERTKKFLFDYDNLSDFEKNIVKRAMPFYTWTGKNMVLQAEQLLKQPGKFANQFKAVNNFAEQPNEQEKALLPDWMQNKFVGKLSPNKIGEQRYFYSLGSPLESVAQMASNPLKGAVGMISPALKAPVELATGKDFFYDQPISEITNAKDLAMLPKSVKNLLGVEEREATTMKGEKYTKVTANPHLLYLLRQTPLSRFLNTSGKVADPKKEATQKYVDLFTGVKISEVDPETQAYYKNKDYKTQLAEPYVRKGILKEYYGNYYIPKNVSMSNNERAEASQIKDLLNDKDINLFAQSQGLSNSYGTGSSTNSDNKLSSKDIKLGLLSDLLNSAGADEKSSIIDAMTYVATGVKPKKGKKPRKPSLKIKTGTSQPKQIRFRTTKPTPIKKLAIKVRKPKVNKLKVKRV